MLTHLHCDSFHSLNVFNSLYQMQFLQRIGGAVAIKKMLSKLLGWKINLPWLSSVIPSLQVGSHVIIYPYHTHACAHSAFFYICIDYLRWWKCHFQNDIKYVFHNTVMDVPCDAIKYLFARGGLCEFENNYKNNFQMVPLSRYSRSLFGLTSMNCGRGRSDNHKAEQSTYSVTCLFWAI